MQPLEPTHRALPATPPFGVRLALFVATGAYSGRSAVMPGTVGTIAAMLLLALACSFVPVLASPLIGLALAAACLIAGTFAVDYLFRRRRYTGAHADPQEVVIDEFTGYYAALIGIEPTPYMLLSAFVLFRLLDITKPPPIRSLERLPGAYGIMADDLAAGLIAAALLNVAVRVGYI